MRTNQILLTIFLVTSCIITSAQKLKRSAFLGAQLVDVQSISSNLGVEEGVFLPLILEEGSLGKMNVPDSTVLLKLNDTDIRSISDVMGRLANIKEGDNLEVSILENGEKKIYIGKAVGRAKEQHPNATISYGEVSYEDNILRSLLYSPKGVEKPPVVFFLQGYTCQTIEMRNNNPAKQLIDQWINSGYAVYLIEKPGMGDSESKVPCMEIDFETELHAFDMALKDLKSKSNVDQSKLYLFGHSMGGIVAPLLAQENEVAGIMVYGIVGNNWYDYMVDIYTEQPLLFGSSEEEIKEDNKYNLPFIEDMLVKKKSNEELVSNSSYGEFLKENGIAEDLSQGYYIARHYTYWQSLADVDIPQTWSKVKAPVLVLHGEYDIQAIHPKYGEMISTNVNKHGGEASFKLFPKSEHAFLKFESREELMEVMNSGRYVRTFTTNFNKEIGDYSIEWMQKFN